MSSTRLTVSIGGREALPVRAIPYVTLWQRYSPDALARRFAGTHPTNPNFTLTSYHLSDDAVVQVKPREWDPVVMRFDLLEADLTSQFRGQKRGLAEWYVRAVEILPAGAFTWLDEFEQEFYADRKSVLFHEVRRGDAELTLSPMIEPHTRAIVMEGFQKADEEVPTETRPVIQQEQSAAETEGKIDAPDDQTEARRINQNRAFLLDCGRKKIPLNIESIWIHIRENAGKEGFLFKSANLLTATTVDGKSVSKKNLARTLVRFLNGGHD